MQPLRFTNYSFRLKNSKNKIAIFDEIRKKFVSATPEEWVRQHVIKFLIIEKNYPRSLINVEKEIKINGLIKRYDIVIYKPDGSLHILVECKAPSVIINQNAFDQIARYNMTLKAKYLMVTNGLNHYFCQMDYKQENYIFLSELPKYDSILKLKL